jgi:hypothetical protein
MGAIRSHFRYLKKLSIPPDAPTSKPFQEKSSKWVRVKWNENEWGY